MSRVIAVRHLGDTAVTKFPFPFLLPNQHFTLFVVYSQAEPSCLFGNNERVGAGWACGLIVLGYKL
jgi:hypothetical protein